jgi:hypothetical protein
MHGPNHLDNDFLLLTNLLPNGVQMADKAADIGELGELARGMVVTPASSPLI